ncbi:MAG: integration host factor subunit alpha [Deltaproteobacteria bacterium]|nr:MAG: integration host factor subunit alpha [Deltaproteobacteria bacterium]
MTFTKAHIIDTIYNNNTDLKKSQATCAFESTMEIIKSTLEKGEDVLISGFGKFYVLEKKKRKGRNPQTGEDLTLDQRRVVVFKCSGRLREKMNKK